ncbi:MAG: efflux RND transporter periplasmic adaptor subunit [Gammaproteobacteria bacterium]|nr:efflux RND transporter periplasmic adaptor subunit [Gammaproteobacteria bacterium]MDE0252617.1 efflux RND transporter periplasmic adaptor subunit [Gammaproteobacteria bacterium]MDE0403503.1 efflux RND transporter periplasmic adaptor subunit [Gammaproteobacteria bacterium]
MKRVIFGVLQILAVVLFVIAVFLFSSAPSSDDASIEQESLGNLNTEARAVVVIAPTASSIQLSLSTTGEVYARSEVPMIPQVNGIVEWVSPALRDGGSFTSNEPLMRIDPTDLELALDQAEANLETALANQELKEAESYSAQENWRLLHPEEPVPVLVSKAPQLRQARAAIQVAEVAVELADLNLARTSFELPFSGRVKETRLGVGQLVTRGQSFGTAYALDAIEIRVPVSEVELAKLVPTAGRTGVVSIHSKLFNVVVDRVSAQLDQRSRATDVFLTISDPHDLVPGQFVNVMLEGRTENNVYRIPQAAEQAGSKLWIVQDGMLQEVVPVILSREDNELIISAFDYGDGLVVGAVTNAYTGMKVAIVEDDA